MFGAAAPHDVTEAVELTELAGNLLSLVVWFIFGAAFVLPAFEHLELRVVIYAALSLTVIRMVPVALALIGAAQDAGTTAFLGWFGPRGLASVVFGLLALEELGEGDPSVTIVVRTIAVTVAASVVAHGVTARPLATRYVRTHAVRE
jgi:NhaP-type Na+/H+ or K+/H+ antiporter